MFDQVQLAFQNHVTWCKWGQRSQTFQLSGICSNKSFQSQICNQVRWHKWGQRSENGVDHVTQWSVVGQGTVCQIPLGDGAATREGVIARPLLTRRGIKHVCRVTTLLLSAYRLGYFVLQRVYPSLSLSRHPPPPNLILSDWSQGRLVV